MRSSRRLIIGLSIITVVMIAGTILLPSALTREDKIGRALEVCPDRAGGDTVRGGDGGRTIRIETDDVDGSVDGLECVLDELDASDALRALITDTTVMMGAQTAEDKDFHYQWSFHSDSGLKMTITEL